MSLARILGQFQIAGSGDSKGRLCGYFFGLGLFIIFPITPARAAIANGPQSLPEQYALEFVQKYGFNESGDLDVFLRDIGVESGRRRDAVVAIVRVMRQAVRAEGIRFNSRAFWDEVKAQLPTAGVSATTERRDNREQATPAFETAETASEEELEIAPAESAPSLKNNKLTDKLVAMAGRENARGGMAARAPQPAAARTRQVAATTANGSNQEASPPPSPDSMSFQQKQTEIKTLHEEETRIENRLKDLGERELGGATSFFHGGVRMLSPFSVKTEKDDKGNVTKATLEKGDGSVSGFLEFVYSNRWAWNEKRIHEDTVSPHGILSQPLNLENWDFDSRLTYNFAKSNENDPSAIVGSGDFGLELTMSGLIHHKRFLNGSSDRGAESIGLDICYGLTTEKSAFDAHHRFFAGPSYTVSFPGDAHRWIQFTTRLGYGRVETVKFTSASTREIKLDHGDIPRYSLNSAIAFETELFYPLRADATLTFGARIYGKLDPNPWTVYIGYSKSISQLAKALLPSSDTSDEPAKPAKPAESTESAAPAPSPSKQSKVPKL